MLRELLLSLSPDTLWQDMQRNRPEGGSRRQALAEPAAQAHAPAFLNGSWTCTVCGKISRTFAAAASGQCAGRLQAAQEAHASHALHAAVFGEAGGMLPLVLCSRCGAHGTSKAVNLAKPCPAEGGGGQTGKRRPPYYRQARAVEQGRHPSRPGVLLHGLAPLRVASRQPPPPPPPAPPPPPSPPTAAGSGAATCENSSGCAEFAAGPGQPTEQEILEGAFDEFSVAKLR